MDLPGFVCFGCSHPGFASLADISEVNGISVDWESRHVYWTDAQAQLIQVADYEGENRRVLLSADLQQPRGVFADPINGQVLSLCGGLTAK